MKSSAGLLLVVLALASCGGGGAGTPSPGTSPPTAQPGPTGSTAGTGPTTVTGTVISTGPTVTNGTPLPDHATLVLDITGPLNNSQAGNLAVGGKATLSGNLVVRYSNGYKPQSGQIFVLIAADGGIVGHFDSATTNGPPASLSQSAKALSMTIN